MLIHIAKKQHPLHHKSIAVVGGGIGGLAFANALLHKDNRAYGKREGPVLERVTIYDQASHFSPTAGAGFGLSPNGQICLSSIGIDRYKDMLHPFDRAIRINQQGTMIRQESNVFEQLRDRVGFGIAGCLRSDMVRLLAEPFTNKNSQPMMVENDPFRRHKLLYSHKLISMNPVQDKVELEFENGVRDVVDLVVGADGIHSPVAKMMNIDSSDPIHAGSNIIYGKIENPDMIDFESPLLHGNILNGAILNGPGTGEFLIFHVGPPERKVRVWVTTYASSASPPPALSHHHHHHHHRQREDEEWNEFSSLSSSSGDWIQETLARYPQEHMIHELAHHTTPNNLLHFGLFYRQHKKTWFHHESNRVVLLGDACHATLPFVGQGANQAIEDAIVLADALFETSTTVDDSSSGTPRDGFREPFQQYYDQRFERTKRVVRMGNLLNKLYHSENNFFKWALDLFLTSLTRGGAMFKQLENEIVQHCPVKDYAKYRSK
jgi:2-polyprenyl-6-methoxyphenol hydroxylase-like FAD-dependent oxidoreductase